MERDRQALRDELTRYVNNEIPYRLIFIPEMKLVDRYFVHEFYRPAIEALKVDGSYESIRWQKERPASVIHKMAEYAILSHRWLPRGEPTFGEMMSGSAAGPGLEKLHRFCEAAGERGLKFAWADTCCIDKTSSAELDEAIRSMFRWYRNATVCIIHLAQTTSLQEMESDEWFERGWTLQELLAPRVVKFFDAQWKALTHEPNDKKNDDIIQHLVQATGCPSYSLMHLLPGPFNVDLRMTWAAKRKTTRGEDVAYSLMGIFNVDLQPAYGEGAARAFFRLVEAIMQSSGSVCVLCWAGQKAAHPVTNAFPSSPLCYLPEKGNGSSQQQTDLIRYHLGLNDTFASSLGSLDLTMTGRGLRLLLVILTISVAPDTEPTGLFANHAVPVKFQFLDSHLAEASDGVFINSSETLNPFKCRFALGVLNYITPDRNANAPGYPALRQGSIAYLLERQKLLTRGPVEPQVGSTIMGNAYFHGWVKRSTSSHIRFNLKTLDPNQAMLLSKDYLETVYL